MTVTATPRPAGATHARTLPPSMLERITLILDVFDGPSVRLTLEDVVRMTGLPRSTAHRILDQLVSLQWLHHSTSGYGLGRRAVGLVGRGGGHGDIREAAAAKLHELQIRTGMVAHLAVLDGADVFYLDKVGGRFAATVPSRVGGRVPAHCTALGKAMLALLEPEQVEAQLGCSINRMTNRTIGEMATLHLELDRIRHRRGLSFERGECFPDIACVAAAIRGDEGPVAGISLVGSVQAPLERVAPLVVDAARKASLSLFPQLDAPRRATRAAATGTPTWSAESMDRFLAASQSGDWL